MRIKKLTNSNVLKPGQLLVVLHCLNQCGSDALFDLRKSIRIGVVQFYRHRQGPVPGTGRVKHGRLFRRPRTTNERRATFSNTATKEVLGSLGYRPQAPAKAKAAHVAERSRRSLHPVSAELERAPRHTAKECRQHRSPNPRSSLLGSARRSRTEQAHLGRERINGI